jgi:hypothetical protein
MNDDYLWDRSGEPDPEVERLENLLGGFRHNRPAPKFPQVEPQRKREWSLAWWASGPRLVAVAAAFALVVVGSSYAWRLTRPAWDVERVAGTPKVGTSGIASTGRLGVGQWLETDGSSRAKIGVGMVGEVEVEPNTRIGLVRAQATEHRLSLERGTMRATIWAPPRLFVVDTPSAVAVDLGCKYTLQVDPSGAGLLHVTYGWVAFEQRIGNAKVESFVPAGAMAATRPGAGPGTPYYVDASEKLRTALTQLDFGASGGVKGGVTGGVAGGVSGGVSGGVQGGVSGGVKGGVPGGVNGAAAGPKDLREAALKTVLSEARQKDALTLWHLLARTNDAERSDVYDRLAQLVAPPEGVARAGILAGDQHMRDLWWDALGLGDTSWWRMWKGPVPAQAR